jgi:deazaflavin-dependent oxidoreductase (nitroreductase family)
MMSEGTRPQRIGYRRPSATERLFGRALALAVRVGVVRGHFYVLEVRGRNTGRSMSTPVDVLDLDGRRYLVSPRGETNWARNARAAGEVVLVRAMHRRRYTARELSPELRPPVLKAYLDRFAAEVQRFFPVPKGSPFALFEDLAPRYPAFELLPANDAG